MDAWVYRLRDAYQAGYYKTEPAEDAQSGFPWQNKTCEDCPFWSRGLCLLHSDFRSGESHTCSYFDPWNREAGEAILRETQSQGLNKWWEWFNDRSDRGGVR